MSHSESWKILFARIPLLKDHFMELRQWTIRYKTAASLPPPQLDLNDTPVFQQMVVSHETPPASGEPPRTPTRPLKFRAKMGPGDETPT
jgi:hypothetical protein